jgi:glucose/arabinose dehydrogenase
VISEPTEAEATLPGSTNTTQASPVPDTPTPQPTAVLELPDPAAYAWQEIAGSLRAPVGLENAGDGSGRMFVLEQEGIIRIIQDGAVLDQPFLDIRDRVGSQASEQGLLGIAFHPQFPENGFFYINYTDQAGDTVIARFQVSPEDPSLADRDSETRLLQLSQPFANHNGGGIKFGPDGTLYLGLGDGGGGGDPQNNAQSLDTLLGKVLRIDVDGGEPYAIPADNPFASGGGQPEIWAYGLRNPWRFSFDRLTGDLYIADVGQNTWEEVNFQPAGSTGGENYGWDTMEGFDCFNAANCNMEGLTLPVVTYPTSGDSNCSVTGGYVYRGSLAEWQGVYLFGDYCSGRVWGLLRNAQGDWVHSPLFENVARISSFGEDEAGEVYLVDHSGSIFQLVAR